MDANKRREQNLAGLKISTTSNKPLMRSPHDAFLNGLMRFKRALPESTRPVFASIGVHSRFTVLNREWTRMDANKRREQNLAGLKITTTSHKPLMRLPNDVFVNGLMRLKRALRESTGPVFASIGVHSRFTVLNREWTRMDANRRRGQNLARLKISATSHKPLIWSPNDVFLNGLMRFKRAVRKSTRPVFASIGVRSGFKKSSFANRTLFDAEKNSSEFS
jgi:hypothetical protein